MKATVWFIAEPMRSMQHLMQMADRKYLNTLQWCHNGHDNISNHQPHECLLSLLIRYRSKKTSKLHVTGPLCGEFTGLHCFHLMTSSWQWWYKFIWNHKGQPKRGTTKWVLAKKQPVSLTIKDILLSYFTMCGDLGLLFLNLSKNLTGIFATLLLLL